MNKEQVLKMLEELNLPKNEFYVLSGASLVLRGIRELCSDLDLCISEELYEKIKDKYELTDNKKNECNFYHISDKLEVVVNKKEKFNWEICEPYNLENLNTILEFKIKRNKSKDQLDIENIKAYLNNIHN